MTQEAKEKILKAKGWFFMNGKWHLSGLTKPMDLASAWLYDSFKRRDEEDEQLFDNELEF